MHQIHVEQSGAAVSGPVRAASGSRVVPAGAGLLSVLIGMLVGMSPDIAGAQTPWAPTKSIRIVVPFTPGGPADIIARTVAERAAPELGQPIVIDNRGGAAGNIGSDLVAKSAPDGHTLILGTNSSHGLNPYLYKSMPFDPVRDFTPITAAVVAVITLTVSNGLPVRTLAEFLDYARRNPGRITYGSSGNGSPHHIAGVMLARDANLDIVHAPYRGGAAAMADVLGGQIQSGFISLQVVAPHQRAGKVRILAVTSAQRFPGLPDVPAVAEILPGFDMSAWLGFLGPAGMPAAMVERLNSVFVRALTTPDVRERFAAVGMAVIANTPDEFARMIRSDMARWAKIIPPLGLTLE